jgi:branched-chain amino acid transport system permease protein
MIRLVGSLITGALLGGTFALIGLGLVQLFRSTATFNFAHGQLMIFPAFLVASLQASTGSLVVAIVVGLSAAALLGSLIFLGALRRTVGKLHFVGFAATLGVASFLDGLIQIVFGSGQRSISTGSVGRDTVRILGASVSTLSLALAAVSIGIAAVVAAFMRFTQLGLKMRAAGQDAVLASQGGINVTLVQVGSWALASTLAAAAGIVFLCTNVADSSAVGVALAGFPAIVLGGLDSVGGAIAGGLVIGLVQSEVATYLGGEYVDVITYSTLVVALLLIPTGFFGTKDAVRL